MELIVRPVYCVCVVCEQCARIIIKWSITIEIKQYHTLSLIYSHQLQSQRLFFNGVWLTISFIGTRKKTYTHRVWGTSENIYRCFCRSWLFRTDFKHSTNMPFSSTSSSVSHLLLCFRSCFSSFRLTSADLLGKSERNANTNKLKSN